MPLHEKSLCPFEYVLNYNPRRIPAALTEVKCSCQKPSAKLIRGHAMECQPFKYDVRVLMFNDECSSFTEHVETITFACIPIIKNDRDVKGDHDFMTEVNADIPQ
uniref:Uncharacterized protein n=1 Tax=Acrobeloides nanus TaxID=290746 RepID=A0A914DZS7_9BILA